MKQNVISPGQWLVTTLILAISLGAYGCADTASVSEDVAAPLSNLTVTPGTLQPGFLANTTNYVVNAPTSATSVTVTAVPKDNTAIVTIDGFVTSQRSVTLGAPGSTTTILIVVETLNGLETTYTVTVTRLLSSDNNLSALTVTPGFLAPTFTSSTLDYTVNVATHVTSVTVSATKSDPNAVISGDVPSQGQATIQLDGPGSSKVISVIITAPNGDSKTYRITVNRAAPSSNNNLSALSVTPGSLDPTFAANTPNYTVNVTTTVTSVNISATKADADAVMSGDLTAGAGIATGQATIPLDGPGTSKVVSITLTAPSGASRTYTVTVNRAAPSSDNNLSALSVTPGSLDPAFTANTLSYTVNVETTVTSVDASATKTDADAVMSGDVTAGTGIATGQATIPLDGPGTSKVVSITVTAPSGASKTYAITVNRAAPSSDTNLSALTVTGGPLVPDFSSNTTTYTLDVPFSVDSVTVSATKSDSNAVMSGDVTAGTGVPAGQATFPLILLFPRTVLITVTAPNGDSKIYSVTITRAFF
ncbi:MAG: cadherin-like beta sandwich domain-containing protein [Nitrospira sp. CG24B]|nr:MAG: cadherin-like beta sandwich domain-containing protein [Nitrospira sp. CG24B]